MRVDLMGVVLVAALASPLADAGDPAEDDEHRSSWLNTTYDSRVYRVEGEQWAQASNETGIIDRLWEETGRNQEYVELFAPGPKISIRIFAERMEQKMAGGWEFVAAGHWGGPAKDGEPIPPSKGDRGTIGVVVVPLKRALPIYAENKTPRPRPRAGVVVTEVRLAGPGAKAGVTTGDLIYRLDAKPIHSDEEYLLWRNRLQPGKSYKIGLLRLVDAKPPRRLKWQSISLVVVAESLHKLKARLARTCPLEFVSAKVGSDVLGHPTAIVVVRNVSSQDVVAYSLGIYCFNRFDEPVAGLGGTNNRVGGISQRTIKRGETSPRGTYWALTFRDTTARVRIVLERVRLADGSEWLADDDQEVAISAESIK